MDVEVRRQWNFATLKFCGPVTDVPVLAPQNRAVVNLFRGPNLIEDVASTMQRLEQGDLKLRVRALDSERALTRVLVRAPPSGFA